MRLVWGTCDKVAVNVRRNCKVAPSLIQRSSSSNCIRNSTAPATVRMLMLASYTTVLVVPIQRQRKAQLSTLVFI